MQIHRKEISADTERKLTIAYIVSSEFLRQIAPIHHDSYLTVQYAKIVCKWCLDHYKKYNKAPGKDIQDIFTLHKNEGQLQEEIIELIGEFLSGLSTEYEENGINEAMLVDMAEKYYDRRKLEILRDNISGCLQGDQLDKANLEVAKHRRVQRPIAGSMDLIRDKDKIISTNIDEHDVLLKLPGELGKLIGTIESEDFMAFIGPMKRGKTFWLEAMAIWAAFQMKKVLFVRMEMKQKKMMRRIYQNFLGQTKTEREVKIPYYNEDDEVCHKTVLKKGLTTKAMLNKARALEVLIRQGAFRLLCYPTYGANVATIKNEIENLAYYNDFYPDVVIVDYADILAPEAGASRDVRHQINETWGSLRRMAQEIHGLVITASQADRSTFTNDVKEENTAEEIRKLAHVTHMIALNQSKEEKQEGIMRLSMLVGRDDEFNTLDELQVLYNYAIGAAYLDSLWKNGKKIQKK